MDFKSRGVMKMARKIEEEIETTEIIDAKKVEKKSTAKQSAKTTATKKSAAKKATTKQVDEKHSVKKSVASKTNSKQLEQEEYMNPEQLAYFKKLLEDWKDNLFEDMQGTIRQIKEDTSKFADPADRASQEEEFSLELRTRDRERKLIKKINASLGLIESGDYGYCKECGEEIGIKRLKARPTATLCVDCKELQEARERQSRS